jgi:hypothetical protein
LLFINLFTRKNIVRLPHNEIPNKKSKIKNQKYVPSCRHNHTSSPASRGFRRCAAWVVGGGISGDGVEGGIKEKPA